jgi:hypothetical protein
MEEREAHKKLVTCARAVEGKPHLANFFQSAGDELALNDFL